MAPRPVKSGSVYDKTRPEGKQEIAVLRGFTTPETGNGVVAFVCEADAEGVCYLSKQHAVEFASVLLMLALGLPGDIPAGDCGISEDESHAGEGG